MPTPKTMRRKIELAVIDAYDIGHAHGSNPYRMRGDPMNPPRRVNDGWAKPYRAILAAISQERRKDRKR